MTVRQCTLAILAVIAVAGCADHHIRSDAIAGSEIACRFISNIESFYIEQAFEGGVLVLVASPDVPGPSSAHFGPARGTEESINDYRVRIARDGVPVEVELELRMSDASAADALVVDFEGRFTPPGSEEELFFGADGLPAYASCG